jgi:ABC-type nitrate/sulfonate/bicarbonate transport system substrate-binding protein
MRTALGPLLGGLLITLAFAACGPTANPAAPAAPPVQASAPAAAPAPPPLPRVRVAYASDSPAELPAQVGYEAGLFAKHGLDVSVERIAGGSSKVLQVMLAGELELAQVGGTAVVDAYLAGADPVYVGSHLQVLLLTVYGPPEVQRLEDLRGKAIAMTRAGTISDFAARYAAARAGLRPEVDVGFIPTGGNAETLAAMTSGNVAAGVFASPWDVTARKLGLHELANLANLGLDFPHNGLLARRDFLADQPEAARRFLRGWIEAIALIKQDKPFTLQVIRKYLATDDAETVESGYETFGGDHLVRAPYPTRAEFQSIVDFVAERDPRARDLPIDRMLDDRLVRALDQEGFIDSLYR